MPEFRRAGPGGQPAPIPTLQPPHGCRRAEMRTRGAAQRGFSKAHPGHPGSRGPPPDPPHPPTVLPRLYGGTRAREFVFAHRARACLPSPACSEVRTPSLPQHPGPHRPPHIPLPPALTQDQVAEPLRPVCGQRAALKAPLTRVTLHLRDSLGQTGSPLDRTKHMLPHRTPPAGWRGHLLSAAGDPPVPSAWSSGRCHTQHHREHAPHRPPLMQKGSQEDSGQSPGVCTACGTP